MGWDDAWWREGRQMDPVVKTMLGAFVRWGLTWISGMLLARHLITPEMQESSIAHLTTVIVEDHISDQLRLALGLDFLDHRPRPIERVD